jgi:hypothetical protein
MASRDYLIRQFEEMGIFLATLLRRILKMKDDGSQQEVIFAVVRESLFKEANLDIDQVIILDEYEFLDLIKEHFTSDDQLEKLADILKVMGQEVEHSFSMTKANYILKSVFLYKYLQENSTSYSYERRTKILELEELIHRTGLV